MSLYKPYILIKITLVFFALILHSKTSYGCSDHHQNIKSNHRKLDYASEERKVDHLKQASIKHAEQQEDKVNDEHHCCHACGQASCKCCMASQYAFLIPYPYILPKSFTETTDKTKNFYFDLKNISSGHLFVWVPPKINRSFA